MLSGAQEDPNPGRGSLPNASSAFVDLEPGAARGPDQSERGRRQNRRRPPGGSGWGREAAAQMPCPAEGEGRGDGRFMTSWLNSFGTTVTAKEKVSLGKRDGQGLEKN